MDSVPGSGRGDGRGGPPDGPPAYPAGPGLPRDALHLVHATQAERSATAVSRSRQRRECAGIGCAGGRAVTMNGRRLGELFLSEPRRGAVAPPRSRSAPRAVADAGVASEPFFQTRRPAVRLDVEVDPRARVRSCAKAR